MFTIGKGLLGLLLLALVTAMSLGCGDGSRRERPERDVTTVGGDYGVVVERSNSGTEVKVGGDRGVVVEHPNSGTEVKIGGDRGVVVEHPRDRSEDDRR
jgi:hypothetical protein